MKKSDIRKLISAYDGDNQGGLLNTFPNLRKGLRKRLFGLRTKGVSDLANLLNSNLFLSFSEDSEIQGAALEQLLVLIKNRDDRIYNSSRSYENYPDKGTNVVYAKLNELLWLDISKAMDQGQDMTDDVNKIKEVVFKRENNKNLHEFRKKANSGDIEARYMLGVNTFIGRQIEYGHPGIQNRLQLSEYNSFSNSNSGVVATHTSVSVTETKKISVVHDGQTITTIFNFLNSIIMSIRTVADTIKLE